MSNHGFDIQPESEQKRIIEACNKIRAKYEKKKEIDLIKLKQQEILKWKQSK